MRSGRMSSVPKQPFKKVEKRLAGKAKLATDAATSARMGRVRQKGTAPELAVRRAVATFGLRYTTHNDDLPGSPDLANRSRRWAIFVHGCYWHRHAGCYKATTPRTNTRFWLNKFARNIERDNSVRTVLRRAGYRVLTIWQCELEQGRSDRGATAAGPKVTGKLKLLAARPARGREAARNAAAAGSLAGFVMCVPSAATTLLNYCHIASPEGAARPSAIPRDLK
jgi:DNA mismatch endonuclease (patch repair protein)